MIYNLYKTLPSLSGANAAYYVDEQGNTISFIFDESNTDYQAYLAWIEAGNTPTPADE